MPAEANAKFPPLRRSALHFLSLLLRSLTRHAHEEDGAALEIDGAVLKRGSTILIYVAGTDCDEVVRVMAREATELIDELRKAILGL